MLLIKLICRATILTSISVSGEIYNYAWKKVQVETDKFVEEVKTELFPKSSLIQCSNICSADEDKRLCCLLSDGSCLVSKMIVTPSYKTGSSDVYSCFTEYRNDLANGAGIYASSQYDSERVKEFLVDGIYSFNRDVFVTKYRPNSWVLLDLNKEAYIMEVRIFAGSNDHYTPLYFTNIEIRVGNSFINSGDFSSYKLFHHHSGGAVPRVVMKFVSTSNERGRFISIQQLRDHHFQMGHIEVLGNYVS